MKKQDVLAKAKSYSAYRGVTCPDRYPLMDRYIYAEVDGNVVCTDTECDVSKDGNIVLVTSDYDVLHIGIVPVPETGKVSFRMDANGILHLRYMVWYDNDHHYGSYEEETIDCHLTRERRESIALLKKAAEISALGLRGYQGGSYRNTCKVSVYLETGCIEIRGERRKVTRYGCGGKPQYAKQMILYQDGRFVLQPPPEGYLPVREIIMNRCLYEKLMAVLDGDASETNH